MFAASKTDSVSASAPEDKFNYVTMLLHGDGTNGAQNNTFVDSSTNNFTITRNGNTTQGSFSPYGSGWSNVFDGSVSSAYLSVATNTAFNCGTGNFTVEAWVNITAYTGSYPLIIGNNNGGFSAGAIALTSQNATSGGASKISFTAYDINSSGVTLAAASTNTIGGWTHFAVVRNGTSLVLYINGASSASTTISAGVSLDFGKNGLLIGGGNWDTANGYYAGYISNLRLVKGTAVYTSAFTPSTTPLTAITNTSLLTCQSNRFIDTSANNFAITATSPPKVQRFNPFGTATAYSTSVIGGSGYFDGSGDSLNATSNAAFQFGTGDFTIEAWVYSTNLTGTNAIFDSRTGVSEANGVMFYIRADGMLVMYRNTASVTASTALLQNSWNHCALTRSGSTCTIWLNGVSVGTATDSTNLSQQNSSIGSAYTGSNNLMVGYISNLRVVKGTAVYTTAFTPPAAPLTAVSNTQLLLNMTNGAIFDNAMMNDLETVGNAQISTSVKKYGTGSMYFDGTGDYLKVANSPILQFGTGDFTIEGWFYLTTATYSNNALFSIGSYNGGILLRYVNGGTDTLYINGTEYQWNPLTNFPLNQWNHVAMVRNGSAVAIYVNGTSVFTTTSSVSIVQSTATSIGTATHDPTGENWTGYIDDFRITKGYARYTANFTAPTAALSDTGPI